MSLSFKDLRVGEIFVYKEDREQMLKRKTSEDKYEFLPLTRIDKDNNYLFNNQNKLSQSCSDINWEVIRII